MKLSHKISIDLLDFVKFGKFDFIKLGQTKEWILNNFPDPDYFDSSNVYDFPVWQYGNIEFHFNENELCLIYSDYIDTLNGGESLELIKWIFTEPQKLSLAYVIEQLNQQRIGFSVEHGAEELSSVRVTIIKSGVELGFSPHETGNETAQNSLANYPKEDVNLFRLHAFNLHSY